MRSTRSAAGESSPTAFERSLATAAAVLVVVALVGFIVTLARLVLLDLLPWLADGPWPYAFAVPVVALPLGFACVIVLIVTSMVRKGRERR